MHVEIEVLRWFAQVADGLTVTEVADIDRVSQPGVSRALARLDREMGTPLLQRSGRLLRPTRAGSVFKRHVDAMLHSLDDGYAALNELLDPETGTVTLTFQLSLGTWLVPGLIRRFRETHPRVQFRLQESDDSLGSALVSEGRTDLEFTARRPDDPEVSWQHLFSQPLVLAVPAHHPLARQAEVSLSEAADIDFVMLHPTWELRALTDDLCAAAGFSPRVAFECDELSVVRGFVAAGLGVAVVPGTGVQPGESLAHGEHVVGLTDGAAHRDVGVAWSESRRLLPSAELFKEFVLGADLHFT